MLPEIGPVPTHGLFVGLGVLAAVIVFVHEARRRGHTDDRLLIVVTGALVGGAVFMRIGTWLQHLDLRENATLITYGDITPLLPAAAIALLTVAVNFVVDWFLHRTSGLRDEH